MNVTIEYCVVCNYRPIAAALAMAIRQGTGLESKLVQSKKSGAFDVIVDGEVIHSKLASGQFPKKEDIVDILQKKGGSA